MEKSKRNILKRLFKIKKIVITNKIPLNELLSVYDPVYSLIIILLLYFN
jgi:hypothetical protein